MHSGTDLRRHSRFDGSPLSALLTLDGAARAEALVKNVSLGGALVTVGCAPALNGSVQLGLSRTGRHALMLEGHVIAVVPRRQGHPLHDVRIRFSSAASAAVAQLYSMIQDLPVELGERDIVTAVPLPADEVDEAVLDLTVVVDDEASIRMAMEQELLAKQLRIEELERQLSRLRRGARALEEELLIPVALAS